MPNTSRGTLHTLQTLRIVKEDIEFCDRVSVLIRIKLKLRHYVLETWPSHLLVILTSLIKVQLLYTDIVILRGHAIAF